jgi:hypothetical protein
MIGQNGLVYYMRNDYPCANDRGQSAVDNPAFTSILVDGDSEAILQLLGSKVKMRFFI